MKLEKNIKLKGMQVITISENLGDSNCIAITINTRKMAEAMASYNVPNSSFICCCILLTPKEAEGFAPSQVASTVNAMMSGQEATTITQDGEEMSVYVEYPAENYKSVEDVQGITLTNLSGNSVPLSDIAQLTYKDSPQTIMKQDGYYNMTISVEVKQDNMEKNFILVYRIHIENPVVDYGAYQHQKAHQGSHTDRGTAEIQNQKGTDKAEER